MAMERMMLHFFLSIKDFIRSKLSWRFLVILRGAIFLLGINSLRGKPLAGVSLTSAPCGPAGIEQQQQQQQQACSFDWHT
jgi:hypothetical protein